jgi:hypothetical protein
VSTRSRTLGLLLVYASALVCAVGAISQMGNAEEPTNRVTVSVDGMHWSAHVEDALFASGTPWTPGQTRTVRFWVRNEAEAPADVEVLVLGTAGQDLMQTGLLELFATVADDGDVQEFDERNDVNVVRVGHLGPGERAAITLRAVLAGALDVDSASVRYRISGTGVLQEDPRLPMDPTGAHLELAPLFLGIALLCTALVMRRTRRRRRTDSLPS